MTKQDYLLTCLQEECAEVILIVAKIKRFGLDSYHPDDETKTANAQNLAREILDIMAIVGMIGELDILPHTTAKDAQAAIEKKLEKVTRYMNASRELGILESEQPQSTD